MTNKDEMIRIFVSFLKKTNSYAKFRRNYCHFIGYAKSFCFMSYFKDMKCEDWVYWAFFWASTEEGWDYWERINELWKLYLLPIKQEQKHLLDF